MRRNVVYRMFVVIERRRDCCKMMSRVLVWEEGGGGGKSKVEVSLAVQHSNLASGWEGPKKVLSEHTFGSKSDNV